MEVLNLDQLADVQRTLTVLGVDYPVMEMTVGAFIETSEEAKRLETITDNAEQLRATIRLIKLSVPDIPEEVLRRMNFKKLYTVVRFIQGGLEDEALKSAVVAEGGEGKK